MNALWRKIGNSQGFTLLELMVIVAIMTILFSITLISFTSALERINLNNTAQVMQSQLRLMQAKAVAEGQYYEIRFDPTLNRYRIFRGSNLVKVIAFEPGISYFYIRTSGGINVSYLRYYATSAPSSGATIAIQDNRQNKRYIIVTPAIGRIRISEQPPE